MTKLIFQDNGAPFSSEFDDIYFDIATGYQQSIAAFIQGNDIRQRFIELLNLDNKLTQIDFVIGETGFGTGLNFLLTLKLYQEIFNELAPSKRPKLKFISVEKYPLRQQDLAKSLSVFPELSDWSKLLVAQYPKEATKDTTLSFLDGCAELQLLIGDATERYSQIETQQGFVHAWYLDGFSPRKNPDMWQLPLYEQLNRLSVPQATISTFTVAGKVRRELRQAGFRVEKRKTDVYKSEIMTGKLQQSCLQKQGYKIRPIISKPQHVAIIGGGIAAATSAYALTKSGVKVSVYCKDTSVAQGASSNAIGALFPLLHQQQDDISLFYQTAFWHARNTYDSLLEQGYSFEHQWCGLLEISYKEALLKRQQQFEQINAWPKELIHSISAEQACQISKMPLKHGGLFMPHAGWISPPSLVKALFSASQSTGRLRIHTQKHIRQLTQSENGTWKFSTTNETLQSDVVVFCGGAEGIKLNVIDQLPLSSVRGQISCMKESEQSSMLSTVICHKGYLTPSNNGAHCIGATFDKNNTDIEATTSDDEYNLAMLHKCLPDLLSWQLDDVKSHKARLRCMTPDHLPMVGAMPNIKAHIDSYSHLGKDKNWKYKQPAPVVDNLYVMTGLGARGLVSAPLLADILVADICGTPYPVNDEQLFNLAPNRFVIRDIIKRKYEN
jgi:tRNA 5-methylaminomethyl-2-thiouridine biosynthesis bifunctional protein